MMRTARILIIAAGLVWVHAAGAQSKAAEPMTFKIEPQPLASALSAFSKQAGLQVIQRDEEVSTEGLVAPRLEGKLTPQQALKELLANSGLKGEFVNERTLRISAVGAEASTSNAAGEGSDRHLGVARAQSEGRREGGADGRETTNSGTAAPEAEASTVQLEEIVVTATKRKERIQDIPLSIAVITADDIERRGLVSSEDYLRGIPGTNQVDSREGQAINIRGIETSSSLQNFWSGTTVATYFGETPTTNSAGLSGGSNVDIKLVDIERVEVLRGPQGTAFGNSSMGGAVRTIPVMPKLDQAEGKAAIGYSATSGTGGGNYNGYLVGNLPLIQDKLAIRGTAYLFEDSGFYSNRAGSDAAFQQTATLFGAEASATDEDEVGGQRVTGGRIAGVFQATDNFRFTLSYLSQKSERDGIALATSGTYEQTLFQVAPEQTFRGQKGGLFDTEIDLVNVMIDYNLGWANLLATYSHIKSGSLSSYPIGSSGFDFPLSFSGDSNHREDSGEIRLTTQLDGAWNFLAGVYAEELDDNVVNQYFWHGDAATNFFAPGVRFTGIYPDRRNLKQTAAFGEASWQLLDGLTLTGGVRAYDYDRTFQLDATGAFYGPGLHVQENTGTSGSNYRANLSYKASEGTLLYAGWSQGFRLGQLQAGLPAGVCDPDGDGIADGTNIPIESTRRVNSDDVDSYEIGSKLEFLDRRLRISADVFRMKWSGMPVDVFAGLGSGGCGLGYLANAGKALSEGVEFQATFQIAAPFRVDMGGSYIHARLTEDVPDINAFDGDRMPGSPKINANLGVQYEFAIGGYDTFVRADSIYVGSFYGNFAQTTNLRSGDYVKLDISARVDIGSLDIALFVRNLTNEDAFTNRGTLGNVGSSFGYRLRPRTVGLQLSYNF